MSQIGSDGRLFGEALCSRQAGFVSKRSISMILPSEMHTTTGNGSRVARGLANSSEKFISEVVSISRAVRTM
jgi:hypothetical protein